MTPTRRQVLSLAGAATLSGRRLQAADWKIQAGPFTSDWDSLLKYRCPDWFRDAKLGIWAVWGPEAVPADGDWYARNMYIEGSEQYKYHLKHYGHPSKFGFKDIVALWKAENWDPDRLMGLYKGAGAKYFIAIANHHDNFDCWNSKYHAWNSVNKGPHKDICGIWRKAALKQGLRFGVTEHNARSWSWFNVNKGADKTGPYAGVPYDGNDPKYQDFYHAPHTDNQSAYPKDPSEAWIQNWFLRTRDLIDNYEPDLMYYDGGVPYGDVGRRIVAHMYNQSVKRHNGRNEAIFNIKNIEGRTDHGEYREGSCVLDVERGVVNDVWPRPWQTDTCIGDWYYKAGIKYKTARSVVHMLADIVSKNGNLLLNLPPRADGTLDADEEKFLADFSPWMKVNGEAIYATRPWKRFGEGPTKTSGGYFGETKPAAYTAADFRFTSKGRIVYAMCLAVPEKEMVIGSLASEKVARVEILGVAGPAKWRRAPQGMVVEMPATKPCEYAITAKLTIEA